MEIVIAGDVAAEEQRYPTRPGVQRVQWLLNCEAPDGLGFRLYRTQYQEGDKANSTPRHHHGFQQIRFAESGSINFGPEQDIPEGDIAYFPRATYYGPQHRDHGVGIFIQFGFGAELPGGKDSMRVYREGIEKLRAHATVENGVVIDVDPATGQERRRESWQAVAQEQTGVAYAIPAERYESPILMHPKAYSYYTAAPGVEIKHLGKFYDHAGANAYVRISMVRLSESGVHRLSAERSQVAWTISPGLQIEGRTYPQTTCFFSPRGEEAALSGVDDVEVYVVEFPRLD